MHGSRAKGRQVDKSDLHLQMGGGFKRADSPKVKRRCQLVVRLKTNKCYEELLCYLFFYNLLVLDPCSGLWVLRRCYWPYNLYHPRACPDHITGYITLIALTILVIVFVLGSIFCFWYCSHYLFLKVRAILYIIHFTHESHIHIQLSIKIHPQNLLGRLESCLDLEFCHRLKLILTS